MSSTWHWRNSPACSEESRTRPWSMHSWPDCLPIPRSCCMHWRNSPACSEESRTRPWSMHSWPDCLPIPRSCCMNLPILTASRWKAYSAEQGLLWTMKGLLPPLTDQPQKKCLYPSPQRTHCIVLTALGPIIWLSSASLNNWGSAVSQLSNATDARRAMSRQNVRKMEMGRDVSVTLAPGKIKTNLPVMRVCINGVMRDALIDSGCTQSHKFLDWKSKGNVALCDGSVEVELRMSHRLWHIKLFFLYAGNWSGICQYVGGSKRQLEW